MSKFRDLRRGLDLGIDMVFDVGANRGQSVQEIRQATTLATIHCFEPIDSTYEQLVTVTARDPLIHCHCCALGAAGGKARMRKLEVDQMCHLDPNGDVEVDVVTGDEFCGAAGIDRVDFLKIDAEGHDLEVLRGFATMIRAKKIGAIQVEAGPSREAWKDHHVPLADLVEHLLTYRYGMFRVYDQVGERKLSRMNVVFVPIR